MSDEVALRLTQIRDRLAKLPPGRVMDDKGSACTSCGRYLHACQCDLVAGITSPLRADLKWAIGEIERLQAKVADLIENWTPFNVDDDPCDDNQGEMP